MNRPIFTDQSIFSKIRIAGGLYVDKTKQIYNCIGGGRKYFFFSRPRRFGKSMLCTTLQALFAGEREFFSGLWIDSSDWEWKKHPVIFLNMGVVAGKEATKETLREGLFNEIQAIASDYGVKLKNVIEPGLMFKNLIAALHKKYGLPAVVIIDEYDKPLLDLVFTGKNFSDVHGLLKNFYGQLKHAEKDLRLVFVTGVYKFAQTSVFSELNNLHDLTLDLQAGDLVGYTQEEIETNFAFEIGILEAKANLSPLGLLDELRERCNGYVFGLDQTTGQLAKSVYCSFAINTMFAANELKVDIWFGTGTPTFLIKQLAERNFEPILIDNLEIQLSSLFNSCEPEKISVETLLYYAGYVTIKSYDIDSRYLQLKTPNREISCAMAGEILPRMGNEHQ